MGPADLDSILALRQAGRLEDAVAHLRRSLQHQPRWQQGWMELGKTYRQLGDRAAACHSFQRVLEINPKHGAAHLNLAQVLVAMHQLVEASRQLYKALCFHPHHLGLLLQLADVQRDRQQWEEAIATVDQAMAHHPTHPAPQLKKVSLLRQNQQFDAAESLLHPLATSHPTHEQVWLQWGHLERQRGNRTAALERFRHAETMANQPLQQRELGLFICEELRELSQWSVALERITSLRQRWPHHLRTQLIYGTILQAQGDVLAAAEVYQAILKDHPAQPQALPRWLTCAQQILRQPDGGAEQVAQIEQGLASLKNKHLSPEQTTTVIQLWQAVGHDYRQWQQRSRARHCYEQALSLRPQHLWANLNLAIEWRELGQVDQAQQVLQNVLIHHPHQLNALLQLGQLAQQQQQWTDAAQWIAQACDHHPDRIEPHLKQVELLRSQGQLTAAFDHLQPLQSRFPDDPQVAMQQGLIHRAQGQREQALLQFQAAQTLAHQCITSHGPAALPPVLIQRLHDARGAALEELQALERWPDAEAILHQSPHPLIEHLRGQMAWGSILQRRDELTAAAAVYQQLMADYPQHSGAVVEYARILSQTGRTTKAIALLTQKTTAPVPPVSALALLGQLHQRMEDWPSAQRVYERLIQHHPTQAQGYCGLATTQFRQGNIDTAFATLTTAQQRLPQAEAIALTLAQLALNWGDIDRSLAVLSQARQTWPHSVPIQVQWGRVQLRQGCVEEAIATLNTLTTDHPGWRKPMAQLRGDCAIQQFEFDQAAAHYCHAMTHGSPTLHERNQLARSLVNGGHILDARDQLVQATQALDIRQPAGRFTLPIKNHVATLINEFRINPPMVKALAQLATQGDTGCVQGTQRRSYLASLMEQDPDFMGTAIVMAVQLRPCFDALQQALRQRPSPAAIPATIVQFWDNPNPPNTVRQLGHTWQIHNPTFTYQRFSLGEAIAFLRRHYDDRVEQAFRLCGHAATQSDLFRLAYLNAKGGFYADADDRCRASLEPLRHTGAELLLYQEDFGCIGNNVMACRPGHPVIQAALETAINNLLEYSAEWAWSQTGPGLLTHTLCRYLLPYLDCPDYGQWPNLLVLRRRDLVPYVWSHVQLPYKGTAKSWQAIAYPKTNGAPSVVGG